MKLRPLALDEDKSSEQYASDDCQTLLAMYDDFYAKVGYNFPWIGYFVVRENAIVGSCSFVGQPVDGRVELAYWTFKDYEGQGVASFACKELVAIAEQRNPELTLTAKTAPEKNASTTVLENNGFVFSGIVQDEEIGDAWLWTRTKN